MGGDPKTSAPIFFTKSRETIVQSGSKIPVPPQTENLHYEVELVVAMASPQEIFGYGTGLDMTRRDLQAIAKKGGKPWDMAKNFDHSAPCSEIVEQSQIESLDKSSIELILNGKVMQSSTLGKMIWTVEEIIKHLSASVDLKAGDLIFTGTPEGVGPAIAGDVLLGEIDGLPSVEVTYY